MQETQVQFPGLGRSNGEGIGYPLQDSWAFLVAQLVKNPAERRPGFDMGWEDPLEKGKGILAWKIPWHGVAKSQTRLSNFHFLPVYMADITN